jgi:uncharacterized membrane protein (DUF4010 family)
VIAVFNRTLAFAVAPAMLGLTTMGLLLAGILYRFGPGQKPDGAAPVAHGNPLELGAAAIFAVLFIIVSFASTWAVKVFGTAGIYTLAVIVGVSDIDPFVLSLAQNGAGQVSAVVGSVAILLATSSNNLLKAVYAIAYSGGNRLLWPVLALAVLAACGGGVAAVMAFA